MLASAEEATLQLRAIESYPLQLKELQENGLTHERISAFPEFADPQREGLLVNRSLLDQVSQDLADRRRETSNERTPVGSASR
jgi:hypothetical protein